MGKSARQKDKKKRKETKKGIVRWSKGSGAGTRNGTADR